MLHGRVYVGTAEAVALGSAHPSCLPAGLFLGGANCAVSSAAGWAVTPAAPARLACPRRAHGPAEAGRGGLPGRVCYFLWSMQTAACGFWFGFLFSSSLPSSACANKLGPLPRLRRSTGTRRAALSSYPGKPQRGVGNSQHCSGCSSPSPSTSGWWDGSLCREMGEAQLVWNGVQTFGSKGNRSQLLVLLPDAAGGALQLLHSLEVE